MKAKETLQKLHSIGSLGNVVAVRGDIRAERLEERIHPRVPFPHKHDFFQIVFIKSGRGFHAIDFKTYQVRPLQIFVIQPGQVHGWELSKATRGYIVEFTSESLGSGLFTSALDAISKVRSLQEQLTSSARSFKNLLVLLERMLEETIYPQADSKSYLHNSLGLVLIELGRLTKRPEKKLTTTQLEVRFLELVEANYKKERSLEFYAEALGASPKNLANAVRKAQGISPKEVIQNRCILEAKRLLAYSDSSIAQVGYELGFEDPNYFSRFFASHAKIKAQIFRDEFKKI